MKKIYPIICIIINVFALTFIPLNLFLFNMPEWITIILVLLILASFVMLVIKGNKGKILLGILSVICICITLFGAYCNPYWNSMLFKSYEQTKSYDSVMSFEDAKSDVDDLMHYLKKTHPIFQQGLTGDVENLYNAAINNLKTAEKIDVASLKREVQGILTSLKDAHTCAYVVNNDPHYLKYVYSHNQENLTLIKINGSELKDFLPLYSYEVESWGLNQLSNDVSTLEGLYYLGIDLTDGVRYTYSDKNGEEKTFTYYEEDFVTYDEYVRFNNITKKNKPFVSYEIDENKSIAVLTLTQCDYNDEYRSCLNSMFTEIKAKGIKNIAVDIRKNGGGSSLVADEFIKYLNVDSYQVVTEKLRLGCFELNFDKEISENKRYNDLTFDGSVFMLTSESSFSSAMMFAEYIKDNNLGQIVGEAPGNAATGYGDIAVFRLKNSGLYVSISTKQFFRADKETDDILVIPDIECDADSALERVLEMI